MLSLVAFFFVVTLVCTGILSLGLFRVTLTGVSGGFVDLILLEFNSKK